MCLGNNFWIYSLGLRKILFMRIMFLSLMLLTFSLSSFSQATVTDYDGNVYDTIHIGSQVWLKQNLKSTHYSDGTPIPYDCYYDSNDSLKDIYGMMMLWDAAMNNAHSETAQGACPVDWHVPSDYEWGNLINYLGGTSIAGYKLKESGTVHWNSPNTGTNSSGFAALPGGDIYNCNWSELIGGYAQFWTSSEIDGSDAQNWCMNNMSNEVFRHYNFDKTNGFSVRCIQDYPTQGINNISGSNVVSFFPSTATNTLTISATSSSLIDIFNVLGEEMSFGNEVQKNINERQIDVRNFPNGIYFIQLSNAKSAVKNLQFGKFIVLH